MIKRMPQLAPLVGAFLLCLLWEDLIRIFQVPSYVMPAPSAIAAALFEEIAPGEGPVYRFLARATWQTGFAAFVGFMIAAVLGIISGTLLASVSLLRRGVYPLANLLQMVPIIAIAPLLNIWFGYGILGVAASATIVSIFPVIANTVDGLRSVSPQLVELFSIYGSTKQQRWRLLEIPAALPQIFTGLRIAAGLAVIGAVVGELVSGVLRDPPIGAVIAANLRTGKLDIVFSAIVCSAIVGFSLFGLVSWLGSFLMGSWSTQHQRAERDDFGSPGQQRRERRGLFTVLALIGLLTLYAFSVSPTEDQTLVVQTSLSSTSTAETEGQPREIRIQLNWVPEPEFGGFYEAKRLGYDLEENLSFTLISGGPGTPSAQLIAQRKVEFGVVDGSEIIALRAKGAPLVGIFASFQTNPRAFITRTEAAPSNLEELWKSKRRLAVEAGSTFMRWLTHRYGKSRMEWVTTQGGLAQFKQDPRLAQAVYVFSEPVSLKLDGVDSKIYSIADSGFNPYAVILTTHDKMVQGDPDLVRRVYRAVKKGWTSYLSNPRPTNEILSKANPSMSLEAMNIATQFARPYIEGNEGQLGLMALQRWSELDKQYRTLGVIKQDAAVKPKDCFWQVE